LHLRRDRRRVRDPERDQLEHVAGHERVIEQQVDLTARAVHGGEHVGGLGAVDQRRLGAVLGDAQLRLDPAHARDGGVHHAPDVRRLDVARRRRVGQRPLRAGPLER